MKTGAVIPSGFVKQNFIFSLIVMICDSLFSFFTGSAEIARRLGEYTNTPKSVFEVNCSFARCCCFFVSDKNRCGISY